MCKFSKRELEVLKLQKEGVKDDKIIADNLGIKNKEQVAVHRSKARRKIVKAGRFYKDAMRDYGAILWPGPKKKYKGT